MQYSAGGAGAVAFLEGVLYCSELAAISSLKNRSKVMAVRFSASADNANVVDMNRAQLQPQEPPEEKKKKECLPTCPNYGKCQCGANEVHA